MARLINSKALSAEELFQLPLPIILCTDRQDYNDAITASGYKTISLNLPLAKSLLGLTLSEIPIAIYSKICNAFHQSTSIYLIDYEVLLDPRYRFNIVRLFLDLSRKYRLIIKWCGTADEDTLTYSEQGYDDYVRIKTAEYDITVVL